MWMYDLTGGFRIGKLHKRLKADAAFAHLPTMPRERLAGGYLYYDATTDDARLVLTIARTAADHGAVVANRCRVVGAHQGRRRPGRRGHRRRRRPARSTSGPRSSSTPPACGPTRCGRWRTASTPTRSARPRASTSPCRGRRCATTSPSSSRCRRRQAQPVRRAVGRRGPTARSSHTYVGTTDTDYDGPLDDPPCTADDIAYVLGALNAAVTTDVTADDVTGVWAGLRPLVKSATSGRTADLSRRHRVTTGPAGVVAITGGKLTTYREMAEDTVDAVLERLGRKARCRTKRLRLLGADGLREPRRRARRPPTSATATARCAARGRGARRRRPGARRAARAGPARTCGPRRCTPSATRWPRRSTTC